MKKLKDFSLFSKILYPLIAGFLVFAGVIWFDTLPFVEERFMDGKKKFLENTVEIPYSIIQRIHKRVESGEINLEEAKKIAYDEIVAIRFDKSNYFFLFDSKLVISVPVKTSMNGTFIKDFKDQNGVPVYLEMIKNGKPGGLKFTPYHFNKPSTGIVSPKLSFSRYFEPWDWYVGTGIFIDDVEEEMASIETIFLISLFSIIFVLTLIMMLIIKKAVSQPLVNLQELARKISKGDINVDIEIKTQDEVGLLQSSFKDMAGVIKNLIAEINILTKAASDGKLDVRGDSSKFEAAYGDIISGFNATIDNIVGPLNVTAEYVDRISKGDIPQKITDAYKGDFIEIKNNVNALIDNLNNYTTDINQFITIQKEGDYEYMIETDKFQGVFREMAEGTNEAISYLIKNMLDIIQVVGAYGEGDLTKTLRPFPGKTAITNVSIDKVKNNLLDVINEMNATVENMINGELDQRADAHKFKGSYKEMLGGFNKALDAVIQPLNMSAEYVDKISSGQIPAKITDNYNGDFNAIKDNINMLIDNLDSFVNEMTTMEDAHLEGQLDVFIPTDKFQGVYNKMALGVNTVVQDHITGVMTILDVIDSYGKGDFGDEMPELKGQRMIATNRVNKFRDNLINIKSDIDRLILASQTGQLDTRANSSNYDGGWKDLIEGINDMLENTSKPITEILSVLNKVSVNDYTEKIESQYDGIWFKLKESVNSTMHRLEHIQQILNNISIGNLHELDELKKLGRRSENDKMIPAFIRMMEAIQALIADTVILSEAAVDGDFNKRADESRHNGDYQKVVLGLNKTIEAFVDPLEMTGKYLEKVAKGENLALYEVDDYKGGFKDLVSYFNTVTEFLSELVNDIGDTARASVAGDLNTRIDLDKYPLTWKEITSGINETLDAVVKPINEAMTVLEIMATGDMTVRMNGQYHGDHELLKSSINMLGSSLSQLIIQLTQSIQEVGEASDSISGTTDTIASSAAEQSSQVDEVAAAMEEMARTITENSSNANKTANFAQNNGTIATEGGSVVEQTISKMREIADVVNKSAENIEKLGQSSKEIGEIISVIDEIADQTNLLALNAAIEAARAGEQGRGFAVVADEVRKLAERTTEATKQIANMIKSIQSETMDAVQVMHKGNEEVSLGINLADNAGVSLKEVVHSSQDVLDMINSIAASSEEQAATGEEISKNINTISIVSNDSARNIEDIAHSAEQMSSLTIKVRQLIQQFKVDFSDFE